MRVLLYVAGLILCTTTPSVAFEKREPYEPPQLTDCQGLAGLSTSTDDGCLRVSGVLNVTGGFDTVQGYLGATAAEAQVSALLDERAGLGVTVGAAFAPVWYDCSDPNGWDFNICEGQQLVLNRGFVSLGHQTKLRAGFFVDEFDSLARLPIDLEVLTDLGLFEGGVSDFPEPGYGFFSAEDGALGLQATTSSNGIEMGVAVEDLAPGILGATWSEDDPAPPSFFGAHDGRLVGTVGYNSDTLTVKIIAQSTGIATGHLNYGNVAGVLDTEFGALKAQGYVYGDSDGFIKGSLSGRFQIGDIFLALGVGDASGGSPNVTGSIRYGDPDAGPSIGLGARVIDNYDGLLSQIDLHGSLIVREEIRVSAAIGTVNSSVGDDQYLQLGIEWQPTSMDTATASLTANSLGGFKSAAKLEHRY